MDQFTDYPTAARAATALAEFDDADIAIVYDRILEVFLVAPTRTADAYLATHEADVCCTAPAPVRSAR